MLYNTKHMKITRYTVYSCTMATICIVLVLYPKVQGHNGLVPKA